MRIQPIADTEVAILVEGIQPLNVRQIENELIAQFGNKEVRFQKDGSIMVWVNGQRVAFEIDATGDVKHIFSIPVLEKMFQKRLKERLK